MPGECPRCAKQVYFSDEAKALGKTWHKQCMKCAQCNKGLDSFTLNPLDGEIYCRACFGKLSGNATNGNAGRKTSNAFAAAQVPTGASSANGCPRCGKAVYFAEERVANGKKWHKFCLKCGSCNKMLDSTNLTEHEGDAYCKSCYGRHFGPRGYGFAGGSAGLSTDDGSRKNIYESTASKSRRASDCFSQAQVPINTMEDSSGAPRCARCSKPVYFAEEIVANRKRWHKLCLKCAECSKQLDSSTLADHEGEAYCRNCYGKLFGPKGFGSHGLSSDTGRRRSTSGSYINPSHDYSKAQVQASTSPGGAAAEASPAVGGADACPRCKKPVYFAEEKVVEYKKWHVNCVTCAKCKKRLDSSTLTEHEGDVYCHNCHKKLFGPKGFGFGSLSMDDGTHMFKPNRSNVPSTDLAYLAPRVNGQEYIEYGDEIVHVPRRASYGSSDICPRCGGAVYAAEKMTGAGSSWHKTCFSCAECNKKLDSSNLTDKEGEIFCKACYGKYFGAKGYGFGGGAGTLQTGEYSL